MRAASPASRSAYGSAARSSRAWRSRTCRCNYGSGDATVAYTVRNTGNATLTARQRVSVSGPFGRWKADSGRIPDSPALLPGTSWKGSAPVRDVKPVLRLAATVRLTPLLIDEAGSISPLPSTKSTGHGWAVPWVPLLGLAAVSGLVAAALPLRPRRRAAG